MSIAAVHTRAAFKVLNTMGSKSVEDIEESLRRSLTRPKIKTSLEGMERRGNPEPAFADRAQTTHRQVG